MDEVELLGLADSKAIVEVSHLCFDLAGDVIHIEGIYVVAYDLQQLRISTNSTTTKSISTVKNGILDTTVIV